MCVGISVTMCGGLPRASRVLIAVTARTKNADLTILTTSATDGAREAAEDSGKKMQQQEFATRPTKPSCFGAAANDFKTLRQKMNRAEAGLNALYMKR